MVAQGLLAFFLATGAEPTTQTIPSQDHSGLTPFRFQLDARLGLGGLKVTADGDPILNGMSFPVALSAGLSLTKALVVFGEISDTRMLLFDTATSNGTSVFDWYGAGVELKYYLTPEYFISGSAAIARLQFQRGDYAMDVSHWGAMVRVAAGREWPVSPTWSVGVAGEYQLGVMQSGALNPGYPTDPPEERYRPWGLSMLVLASFHQAEPAAPGTPVPTSSPAPLGLYLDARVGMGALWTSAGDGFSISGMSVPLALAAGMNVTKTLVAFGEINDIHMLNPAFHRGDMQISILDLYGAGLGLKYYLAQRRVFLSGSVSLSRLRYQGNTYLHDGVSETSLWGAVARVSAGRQWPISPSWSVGVAGELQLGRVASGARSYSKLVYMDDNGDDPYRIEGLSLVALATFTPPAQRESAGSEGTGVPATRPVGYHTHDGLYFNISLGTEWLWARSRRSNVFADTPDTHWSGRGTSLALSIGYAFANRLVVFGEFSETQVRAPTGEAIIASLEWHGFGPGLRYYITPVNVFFSGALLVSKVAMSPEVATQNFSNRTSQWGATGQLSVGKEWWLLSDLGVGVAAEFGFGKMAGNYDWLTYTAKTLSLLASVSYN